MEGLALSLAMVVGQRGRRIERADVEACGRAEFGVSRAAVVMV